MLAEELRPGDQFAPNGRVEYTLVAHAVPPWPDEVSFRITPTQAGGIAVKTWKRGTETKLVRP